MLKTEINCDNYGCDALIRYTGIHTKGSMIRSARKKGWSIGKWDLCPDCRKVKSRLIKEGWIK